MRVETLRFGEIEVAEEAVLTFPEGLWGFPEVRRFCLISCAGEAGETAPRSCLSGPQEHAPYEHPVRWLQSLEDPTLAFLAINPFEFFPDYDLTLSDGDQAALSLQAPDEAALLALLTVSQEGGAVTANLAGPLVINTRTRQGRQVVLDDPRYVTRHLVASLARAETAR